MALEPITRQEQIIAGKDLEPITRMEKFLKEYGGGGGGGASHWNELEGKPFVTVGGKEQIDPAVLPESDIVLVQLDEETNNVIQPMTELLEQQKKGKTLLVGGISAPFTIATNEDGSISDGVWTTFIGTPYNGGVHLMVVSCKYNAEGTVTSMGQGIIRAEMS